MVHTHTYILHDRWRKIIVFWYENRFNMRCLILKSFMRCLISVSHNNSDWKFYMLDMKIVYDMFGHKTISKMFELKI